MTPETFSTPFWKHKFPSALTKAVGGFDGWWMGLTVRLSESFFLTHLGTTHKWIVNPLLTSWNIILNHYFSNPLSQRFRLKNCHQVIGSSATKVSPSKITTPSPHLFQKIRAASHSSGHEIQMMMVKIKVTTWRHGIKSLALCVFCGVCWVVPLPSNRHHQDYYSFWGPSRDPYTTVTERGDKPICVYVRFVFFAWHIIMKCAKKKDLGQFGFFWWFFAGFLPSIVGCLETVQKKTWKEHVFMTLIWFWESSN